MTCNTPKDWPCTNCRFRNLNNLAGKTMHRKYACERHLMESVFVCEHCHKKKPLSELKCGSVCNMCYYNSGEYC